MTTMATINPMAMTIEEAARLLSAAGRPVTIDMLEAAKAPGRRWRLTAGSTS